MATTTSRNERGRNHPCESVFIEPHISHEIIVEILSRLPVKSLCRFRCVSKLWLSTISSPQFAKTHLDLAFQNNTERKKLIYWAGGQLCSIGLESVSDSADDVIKKSLVAHVLDNSLKDNACFLNSYDVLCSSNGLVCIVDNDKKGFLVINPCTGESRRVLRESQEHDDYWYTFGYGFGYSSKSDDYKLVIMDRRIISMYSLRSDTWSEFTAPLHYDFPLRVYGVPLNGAFHWIGSLTVDGFHKYVVVTFDLDEKTFREMPLPSMSDYEDSYFVLGVVNGCLLAHYCSIIADSFWVMREYNNGKSWTEVSVGLVPLDTSGLGAKKNAHIEYVDKDIRLCTFENGTHGIPTGFRFEKIGTYVESLISPNHYVGK